MKLKIAHRYFKIKIAMVIIFCNAAFTHNDVGVATQSFGGAFRAVANNEEIMFSNPAGLIKKRRTGANLFYQTAFHDHTHHLGLALADAQAASWGMGLGYVAGFDSNGERPANHLVKLALSMPIITDMFSLGTSFSYLYDRQGHPDSSSHFFNMDAAFMINAPLGLSFALVLDHLLNPKGHEKSMGLAIAAAFDASTVLETLPLTIALDWVMDDVKSQENLRHVVSTGLEYLVLSVIPIRFGYKHIAQSRDNFLSLGSGFKTESFSVDGVYQQHLTFGKNRYFGISLTLNM